MENFWRILSWGGIVPSPLADWQQPRGLIGKLWNQLWSLHMRHWWGGRGQDTFKTTPHSKTVISYIKGVERKWYIWNITQRIPEEGAKQRIQKWIGFGGAFWHLCGGARLAVTSIHWLTPKSVPIGRAVQGHWHLCHCREGQARKDCRVRAQAPRDGSQCWAEDCRELPWLCVKQWWRSAGKVRQLCFARCAYRFQLSNKANGHETFF